MTTEVTPDMQEQIDAVIWNIGENILFNLDDHRKQYLNDHLVNLVETCLWLAAGKPEPVAASVDVFVPVELETFARAEGTKLKRSGSAVRDLRGHAVSCAAWYLHKHLDLFVSDSAQESRDMHQRLMDRMVQCFEDGYYNRKGEKV